MHVQTIIDHVKIKYKFNLSISLNRLNTWSWLLYDVFWPLTSLSQYTLTLKIDSTEQSRWWRSLKLLLYYECVSSVREVEVEYTGYKCHFLQERTSARIAFTLRFANFVQDIASQPEIKSMACILRHTNGQLNTSRSSRHMQVIPWKQLYYFSANCTWV